MGKWIHIDTSQKNRHKVRIEDFLDKLKPGDIILTGSWLSPISIAIQLLTKSRYSHSEIYIGSGVSVGASYNGIRKTQVTKYASFHSRLSAYRPKDHAPLGYRVAIFACSLCDRGYDYFHVAQYLWRILLGTLGRAPMNDLPDKYVCHEFTAVCWHKFNVKIGGTHPDNATGRSFIRDNKLVNVF